MAMKLLLVLTLVGFLQTPSVPPTPTPKVETEFGTALVLIDRMQRVLDEATKDELGKVSLKRGDIDELRAELGQIRTILEARNR